MDKICDFCAREAVYDGKTKFGPWAFLCEKCFQKYCIKRAGFYTKLKKE